MEGGKRFGVCAALVHALDRNGDRRTGGDVLTGSVCRIGRDLWRGGHRSGPAGADSHTPSAGREWEARRISCVTFKFFGPSGTTARGPSFGLYLLPRSEVVAVPRRRSRQVFPTISSNGSMCGRRSAWRTPPSR